MRFSAPPRASVDPATFEHPAFAAFRGHLDLLVGVDWPAITEFDARLAGRRHAVSGRELRFVPQTPALLADGMHYEARIWAHGTIATRESNWHDLFNALMWFERTALKSAVNCAYQRELPQAPQGGRTPAQSALTHFDEGGALVLVSDPALLEYWDRHDWAGLLFDRREAWLAGAKVVLLGHALLEQYLVPELLPVAKCLVVTMAPGEEAGRLEHLAATALAQGQILRRPSELRPLPLAGLPGWHARAVSRDFFATAPCFRPLRPGRRYPPAWQSGARGLQVAGSPR